MKKEAYRKLQAKHPTLAAQLSKVMGGTVTAKADAPTLLSEAVSDAEYIAEFLADGETSNKNDPGYDAKEEIEVSKALNDVTDSLDKARRLIDKNPLKEYLYRLR